MKSSGSEGVVSASEGVRDWFDASGRECRTGTAWKYLGVGMIPDALLHQRQWVSFQLPILPTQLNLTNGIHQHPIDPN